MNSASVPVFPLADYEDLYEIDRGSFGVVVCARHRPSGRRVALKRVDPAKGPEMIGAEAAGAELQDAVSRQYVRLAPAVYQHGPTANGGYAVAMELIEGVALSILIRSRPTTSQVLGISRQIATFLVALKSIRVDGRPIEAVVHSDLKPEHIFVLADGSIRVLDFGITKQVSHARPATINKFLSIHYSSPERLSDGNVHPNDDAWSLGVIMFEMAAGEHPWSRFSQDEGSLIAAIRGKEPPAPLPASCGLGLRSVILKTLAPQSERRYSSPESLISDLDLLVDGRDRETVAMLEAERASRATKAAPRLASASKSATTAPLPVDPARKVDLAAAVRGFAGVATRQTTAWRGSIIRIVAALIVAAFVVSEGVVWVRAERLRDRVPLLRSEDLSTVGSEMASMRRWSLLAMALPLRLDGPLKAKVTALWEATLSQYRSETPALREPQWRDAARVLAAARQMWPRDTMLRARARYVEGQLKRISAEDESRKVHEARLREAVAIFSEAAQIDPLYADPYLGLARIHSYDLPDLEALLDDIHQAELRGYVSGRRERAQIGGAFKIRADEERGRAVRASGDDQRRLYQAALADYESCVAKFDGMSDYLRSQDNAELCGRLRDSVAKALERMER